MHIGEQIINPTEDRLRLSAQLGVGHVVIDTRPDSRLAGPDGHRDAGKVADCREWVEAQGLTLECLALDLGSFLIDARHHPDRAGACEQELREAFLFTRIDAGGPLWGNYPADEATLAAFEDWKAAGGSL